MSDYILTYFKIKFYPLEPAKERVQLGCLLHDASESYISDLTRPVKRNLPEYAAIGAKLQSIIYDRFG